MSKKKFNKIRNSYNHQNLKGKLGKYDAMRCYSFNKRNHKQKFDELSNIFSTGFPFEKDEIQSIDFIYSGSTSGQYLLTAIVGRLDKDNMFDRDVFNIFPEDISGDTYSTIQTFHFKDGNGKRLTEKFSKDCYTTDKEKINGLYDEYLTGTTTVYSINDYLRVYPEFIEACHIAYKKYLNK